MTIDEIQIFVDNVLEPFKRTVQVINGENYSGFTNKINAGCSVDKKFILITDAFLAKLTDDQQKQILYHEMGHVLSYYVKPGHKTEIDADNTAVLLGADPVRLMETLKIEEEFNYGTIFNSIGGSTTHPSFIQRCINLKLT